ncbi:MAG: hypothetical protein HQL32_02410 [Planctomycetes bacterium]|nr:hypothetical protein [Planctomycetota bacterium]
MKRIQSRKLAALLFCLAIALFMVQHTELTVVISLLSWLLWAFLMKKHWPYVLSLLALLSTLPYVLSASFLSQQKCGVDVIYLLAQSSPLYLLMRMWANPWVSQMVYGDSPQLYAFESAHQLYPSLAFALFSVLFLLKNYAED